jgi:VWFA-related protein
MYARRKLLHYLETQLSPGQGTAILALGNHLRLLQDFTDDPQLLRAALQELSGRKPTLLTENHERVDLSILESHARTRAAAVTLYRMEDEQIRGEADIRLQVTLAALRSIARAVAGYPGRKILVWVSSSFPLTLQPEQFTTGNLSLTSGLAGNRKYMDEVRQTAALLAYAQVAIYPVDARGLMGSTDDPALGGRPGGYGDPDAELLESQGVMQQLAEETGGRAFFNRNDIDRAAALSAADGTIYYQLGFYPAESRWDGKFHRLAVHVSRPGLQLRTRRGFFAEDPLRWREASQKPDEDLSAALRDPLPATQVTFVARVLEKRGNPRTVVDIQFAVYAGTLSFEEEAGGQRHAKVDFFAVAYAPDGTATARVSKSFEMHLRPETFARVEKEGVPYHLELEVTPGRYQLILAVRDSRTGAVGTTAVPLLLEPEKPSPQKQ